RAAAGAAHRREWDGAYWKVVARRARSVGRMGDTPTREAVAPLLRGRFGHEYLFVAECASTQRLLAVDAPEGAVAVTDFQSEGRGRLGRRWDAPAGTSLLVSVQLLPRVA